MTTLKSAIISTFFITVTMILSLSVRAEPVEISIQGNKAYAEITLPGDITADITLTFENTVGLTKDSIGISAELVDFNALSFLSRLSDPLSIVPAVAFPMMITVEPLSTSGFAFEGLASVDIHTHNLEYTASTPLRFFKAPLNGEFKDITVTMGAGSYRARGSTGKFSQFIIAADLRPVMTVVDNKFADLQAALVGFSSQIAPGVYTQLSQLVSDIDQSIASVQLNDATKKLNQLKQLISNHRGLDIPDVWRSSRDIDNVAGELLAYANTLRFSLRLAQ